jgi:CelD/BcsL family acetyltransferase involved in cellulose biosynthesis
MYSYKIYSSFNQELKKDWEHILGKSDHTFYQLYELNKSWYETIGSKEKGAMLNVVVIFYENEVVGLTPTMISKKPFFINELGFLGQGLFDYHQLLIDNTHVSKLELLNYLFETLKKQHNTDVILFNNVPLEINSEEHIYSKYLTKSNSSNALLAELPTTYQEYFGSLKTSIRGDTRRQTKKMESFGELSYNSINRKDEYFAFINDLVTHKRKRYNKTLVKDIFNNINYIKFLENLFDVCQVENIHASSLSINDEPVSFHLGFKYDKRYYYYMPSFNEDKWGKYSPSRIHMLRIIEESVEDGMSYFDFTIGDEKYKKYYAGITTTVNNYHEAITHFGNLYISTSRFFRIAKKKLAGYKLIRKVSKYIGLN